MVTDASKVWGNDSFGSLRERSGGFKCCTEHFLTFLTAVRSKLIALPSFSLRGSVKTSVILCLRQTLAIPL